MGGGEWEVNPVGSWMQTCKAHSLLVLCLHDPRTWGEPAADQHLSSTLVKVDHIKNPR